MDSVIKVEGLSHNYGKKLALDNVSFEIEKGRVFGLGRLTEASTA